MEWIIVLALFFFGALYQVNCERKLWNKGVCKQTGKKWVKFDTSSQGCRGYVSDDVYIWISWPVDSNGGE